MRGTGRTHTHHARLPKMANSHPWALGEIRGGSSPVLSLHLYSQSKPSSQRSSSRFIRGQWWYNVNFWVIWLFNSTFTHAHACCNLHMSRHAFSLTPSSGLFSLISVSDCAQTWHPVAASCISFTWVGQTFPVRSFTSGLASVYNERTFAGLLSSDNVSVSCG